MSQDTASMPSQDSATDATILDAAGGVPMEDETCMERPTLKCTPEEEWVLLNTLFTGSLDQLEDVLLGYLNVLVARINQIRKVKASQTPMPSPRALPGLPPLSMGQSTPVQTTVSSTTVPLSEAIYSATSNLGTTVPHPNQRMPTRPPDQAEMDQAMRVLECLNKAPGSMPDCLREPWSVPWSGLARMKNEDRRQKTSQHTSHCNITPVCILKK